MIERKIIYEPRYKCRICGKHFLRNDLMLDHEPNFDEYRILSNSVHDCNVDFDLSNIDDKHIYDFGVGDLIGFFVSSTYFDPDSLLQEMIKNGELNQKNE